MIKILTENPMGIMLFKDELAGFIASFKKQGKEEDEIFEIILEAGADDLVTEDDYFEVTTDVDSFETVRKTLVDVGLEIENASLQWIAKNTIEIEGEAAEKVEKLFDMLDDSDDVQNVYFNADFKE
jgi:transcriptional/translational regulatory protein YebC/TACO1